MIRWLSTWHTELMISNVTMTKIGSKTSFDLRWLTLCFVLGELPDDICILFSDMNFTPIVLVDECLQKAEVRSSCSCIYRKLLASWYSFSGFSTLDLFCLTYWLHVLFFLCASSRLELFPLFLKLSFLILIFRCCLLVLHCFNHWHGLVSFNLLFTF